MFSRSKLLLLSALVLCIVAFVIGCDQPEDVITPTGNAYLTLAPSRLPDNPAGTVYELWVANSTDTISIEKFGYNYETRNFLTAAGVDRQDENKFLLEKNIDSYDRILVSVEPESDAEPLSPASIMLMDYVSSPTIKLVVPLIDSLWSGTVRYNMKATSDGISTANDGRAIWFCNYGPTTKIVYDTTALAWSLDSAALVDSLVDSLINVVIDTVVDTNVVGVDTTYDSTYVDMSDTTFTLLVDLNVIALDSIISDSVMVVLARDSLGVGIDTVYRDVIRYTTLYSIDTFNYYPTTLVRNYTFDSTSYLEQRFTQDDFEIPNLQTYGWKYRGWVISDVIPTSAIGNLTLPSWTFLTPGFSHIDGGLLSTGVFYDINVVDNDNNYLNTTFRSPPRTPQFPGEDFLTNLPVPIGTLPNLAGTNGHVFVSLEPEFYNDTTNFPLIAFVGDLPSNSNEFYNTQGQNSFDFTLAGKMNSNDPYRGFPLIQVTIERF